MNSAELLTNFEACQREGVWSADWRRPRLDSTEMLRRSITAGLMVADRSDYGDVAGEEMMELAVNPGMETPASHHIHESVVHHAALADMLTSAIRAPGSPPWEIPAPTPAGWTSSAFLDPSGDRLRRVVIASSWNDDRHYSEIRSWFGLGEVAMYGLPMTMAVVVIGQQRDGKRSSPWTRGFLHPYTHKLRLRKKTRVTGETFSEKWEQIWREDRGEISTRTWLQAMLDDDILRDVCFTVDIDVPSEAAVTRIKETIVRELDYVAGYGIEMMTPEVQFSTCSKCQFLKCCWSDPPFEPSEKSGFVRVQNAGGFAGDSGEFAGDYRTQQGVSGSNR